MIGLHIVMSDPDPHRLYYLFEARLAADRFKSLTVNIPFLFVFQLIQYLPFHVSFGKHELLHVLPTGTFFFSLYIYIRSFRISCLLYLYWL